MQIVIDIPEEEYNIIKKFNAPMTWAEHIIAAGTPLPKGQPCDNCEVGNPCLYCKYDFEPQESEELTL